MGNLSPALFDCSCIEGVYQNLGSDAEAKAARDRIELLQRGAKFARKALLGLTSQEMFLKLSEDTTAVEWKTIGKNVRFKNCVFNILERNNEIDSLSFMYHCAVIRGCVGPGPQFGILLLNLSPLFEQLSVFDRKNFLDGRR